MYILDCTNSVPNTHLFKGQSIPYFNQFGLFLVPQLHHGVVVGFPQKQTLRQVFTYLYCDGELSGGTSVVTESGDREAMTGLSSTAHCCL